MKKLIFIVLFFISTIPALAQGEIMHNALNLSYRVDEINGWRRDVYIEGTPYRFKEAEEGSFYQKNKPVVVSKTRLNYLHSNFEFTVDDKTYLVDNASIDSIIVDGKKYLYKEIEIDDKKLPRIVEVVEGGEKNSLYKFTAVEIKPEVKPGPYVDAKPASYFWKEPVYLIEIGDKLISLTSFKKLTSEFPEKESELKEFLKKNKIKKDNPEDLKQLLHYLNQLI